MNLKGGVHNYLAEKDQQNDFEFEIDSESKESDLKLFIDHKKTIDFNQRNIQVESFVKHYLQNHPKSFTHRLCLVSNILNVLHIALVQICIASLPHSPRTLLGLLMVLEVLFCLLTLIPYCFHHKFISLVELLSKTMKSLCIGGFFVVCIIISHSSDPRVDLPVNGTVQSIGMVFIALGICFTYIFTIIKIIKLVIKNLKERSKNKKKGQKNKNKLKGNEDLTQIQRGLIFYKGGSSGIKEASSSSPTDILNQPLENDFNLNKNHFESKVTKHSVRARSGLLSKNSLSKRNQQQQQKSGPKRERGARWNNIFVDLRKRAAQSRSRKLPRNSQNRLSESQKDGQNLDQSSDFSLRENRYQSPKKAIRVHGGPFSKLLSKKVYRKSTTKYNYF